MYIQNRRNSSKFKSCSPLQFCSGLISLKPAIAYFAYTKRWGKMPAAARPAPQAAPPVRAIFPQRPRSTPLIRYIYSTFNQKWPARRSGKKCTFPNKRL